MQIVPTLDVSGVNVSGTGRRIVEPHGQSTIQQTAAGFPYSSGSNLVDSPEDLLTDQQLGDDLSDYPIPKYILQVPFEFESTLSASLRVKGSLTFNSGTTSVRRVLFCLLYETVTRSLSSIILRGFFSGIIGLH